ncbi:MAG: hypothetical protein GY925_09610 [Actinomycetia bacterium]|nr:hypothetical protein [Actinomycetes bacterium]
MVECSSGVALTRSPVPRTLDHSGYWLVTAGGDLYPFGDTSFTRSSIGPVVASTAGSAGVGLWAVRADGSVIQVGGVSWFGDAPMNDGESAVAIAATSTNMGYWVFTDRGRAVAFGDAEHLGDLAGIQLAGPIIAALSTPSGDGYYMVASDGGVFSFGDAPFLGSVPQILPGVQLAAPIVGMSPTPEGGGYWLVASDGGVFNFSNLAFDGSLGADPPDSPVIAVAPFSP